jgi:hypothetical protein
MFRAVPFFLLLFGISAVPQQANAQGTSGATGASATPSPKDASSKHVTPATASSYTKPTEAQKFRNYLFDGFGPYPIVGSALAAGINQAYNHPPEWGQGGGAYGQRVASNFGIELVTTSTRYALAEAFREDTIYYRCDCRGIGRRIGHALISTFAARRGDDGHRVFSFPAIAAPYAGTMAAALGWYPARYNPKDGFRTGNYNLALQGAENLALEFIYGGPHTLLPHFHQRN